MPDDTADGTSTGSEDEEIVMDDAEADADFLVHRPPRTTSAAAINGTDSAIAAQLSD